MSLAPLLPEREIADLTAYLDRGGAAALAFALDAEEDEVLDLVDAAGLRGRGGAGFPTARKWRSVREHAQETGSDVHVVVNAAEGEPGTAKDRMLLARDPYAVLEGLLVAMHVTDAVAGWVGIKARFEVVDRVVAARDELVAAGWRGADRVRVAPGPDDYLFGEESALLEVIEGGGALPRILKPYDRGLFGDADGTDPNPTVVNNVETFAHVTWILTHGVEAFRAVGTDNHPGTLLATVVGDVARPGVVEVPTDTTLRELVIDAAGAETIKIVASGVSNPLMTSDHLDLPLDLDAMHRAGGGLGSAGFVVYDADRSAVRVTRTLQRFLADSSCGQCTACITGTAQMAELLDDLCRGRAERTAVDELLERARLVNDQARCYLPTGAQQIALSAVALFEDEFVAAIDEVPPDGDRSYPIPMVTRHDPAAGVLELGRDPA